MRKVKREMMLEVGVWILLGVSSIYDFVKKKIPIIIIASAGGLGFLAAILQSQDLKKTIISILPGLGLLFIAFITKESVGYGDGLIILVLGILEGARACLINVCIALFLVSISGVVLLICKKGSLKTEIPFVPFLLVSHILVRILEL